MLLAIDAGNTDTKFGVHDDNSWVAVWRKPTSELADLDSWLREQFAQAQLGADFEFAACASVVPSAESSIAAGVKNAFGQEVQFLRSTMDFGLEVRYEPPESVGIDRLMNCLGASRQFPAPLVVIDFGSATTFDVVRDGRFLGGAILPGLELQAEMLSKGTAQLQEVPLEIPQFGIGNSTVLALQSGLVFGHIGAVEGIVARIRGELGEEPTMVATGGLSHLFIGATEAIQHFVPYLTLEGVAVAVTLQ